MAQTARLDLVLIAICAGYRGQIEWQDACLRRFRADPEMQSFTEKGIKELLCYSVRNKGCQVRVQQETDPERLAENPHDPWWYFVVLPVPIFPRGLFIKVKLLWEDGDDEDDAFVQIVSIHEEREGKIL